MFLWIVLLVVLVVWSHKTYTQEGLTNPEIKKQMETNYDSITAYLNKIQGMVTHL